MKGQKTLFSHQSDEWETPQDLYNQLNQVYDFTLDPCATKENAKCANFFTTADNGLKKDWSGNTVFVNPPFSDISSWVEKAWTEMTTNDVTTVMLLPARTDTKWFHNYIYNMAGVSIEFLKGRLRFNNAKNSAPFPSMVVVFSGKK